MINGMTGFGSAQAASGRTKVLIEIKSLNHRYFDVNYYLPIGFSDLENRILQMVKQNIARGRVSISIKILEKPEQTVRLNKAVVKKYMSYAKQLKKEWKLENDMTLSHLIAMPGIMDVREADIDPNKIWPALEKGLVKAVRELVKMRRDEGRSVSRDVSDKLRRMGLQIKKIIARSKVILKEKKNVLSEDEYKSFIKSNDINEEIERFSHYIIEMKKLLNEKEPVGKKMDFIGQEMQREVNTMGAKLQDKIVSACVIALKSKIEKVREQAQNIE